MADGGPGVPPGDGTDVPPGDGAAVATVRGPWTAFAALRHRNFRLLWSGMLVSQTGSWMQFIALGYLIDQLTQAPIYLGVLGISQAVPRLLFAMVGGVAADRFDRRRVLLVTNLLLMASATLLWLLAFTGRIQVWHVLVIAAVNSITQSFDVPTRHSMLPLLVGDRELLPALSLNTMAMNGSGIFGPSIGGVVIALVGVEGCFLLNALSYIAAVAALLRMEIPPQTARRRMSIGEDIREGLGVLGHNRHLLAMLGVVGVLGFFGRPYIRLMPAVAREVLGVGPTGLGVLQAAPSVGTILAVLVVGAFGEAAGRGRLLLGAAVATGTVVALFGASTWFAVSVGLLILAGTGQALAMAAGNTILQTAVPPGQRGRMMGIWSMVNFGMFALGTLPLGALAGEIGVGRALTVGGAVVVVVVSLLRLLVPRLARL